MPMGINKSKDTPVGTVTNTLSKGGAGGGYGSRCLTENQPAMRFTPEPSKFRDERGTFWLNQHESSARRGQARSSGMANGSSRKTGGGGNSDVGGR